MTDARIGRQDTGELTDVARDAYVFFFLMLMRYRYLSGSFLALSLASHLVPENTFGGQPRTLGPSFRDVITPNADTPYSMAGLDLRGEPMVLSVPAVTDRYLINSSTPHLVHGDAGSLTIHIQHGQPATPEGRAN